LIAKIKKQSPAATQLAMASDGIGRKK